MAHILDKLQVFGYSRDDERTILASLLTGEGLLLIGDIGASKTTLGKKVGKALGVQTQVLNAAVGQFDDIIGFINPRSLADGKVDFIRTPTVIWDKELVLVDEINRPNQNTANKWLDFLADREMLGRPTGTKWVWGAMNPLGTRGTNSMGEATVGRFAAFVFAPNLLGMSTGDRSSVVTCLTTQNLPAISHWGARGDEVEENISYVDVGHDIANIMKAAAKHYKILAANSRALDAFLEKFARLIYEDTREADDTDETIKIDGRRIGMLRRLVLATRAIAIAQSSVLGTYLPPFAESVRAAMRAGLPIGVNNEIGRPAETMEKVESRIRQLLHFLSEDATSEQLHLQYELLTTNSVYRKAEILLDPDGLDLEEAMKSVAWAQVTKMKGFNSGLVAFVALGIEAELPGTVPEPALDQLNAMMNSGPVAPQKLTVPPFLNDHRDEVMRISQQKSVVSQLIAAHHLDKIISKMRPDVTEEEAARQLRDVEVEIRLEISLAQDFTKLTEKLLARQGIVLPGKEGPDAKDSASKVEDSKVGQAVAT